MHYRPVGILPTWIVIGGDRAAQDFHLLDLMVFELSDLVEMFSWDVRLLRPRSCASRRSYCRNKAGQAYFEFDHWCRRSFERARTCRCPVWFCSKVLSQKGRRTTSKGVRTKTVVLYYGWMDDVVVNLFVIWPRSLKSLNSHNVDHVHTCLVNEIFSATA